MHAYPIATAIFLAFAASCTNGFEVRVAELSPEGAEPMANVPVEEDAPESNVTTPEYDAPESTTPDYDAPESNETTPDYDAPESTVTTPDYEAPESNVTTPDYDAPEENATTPFGGFGGPPADNGEDDLSGGAIAAIVICSIVLVGVVAGFLVFRKRSYVASYDRMREMDKGYLAGGVNA
ncbi:hypothetical protein DIPPA_24088 [Diplonema papillatum]|nr:hypothetical protein DIPPA_24088 [Diplonema papillatum]